MPMYLVHGFRWPRRAIRIHIILENIDDAAAEYLVAPQTHAVMLESLCNKFPEETKLLPKLRFVEQHDPNIMTTPSQPYAFVVDKIKPFDLSFNIKESLTEAEGAISEKQTDALKKIAKELAPDEQVGWWVVYNGDEGRMDGVDVGREWDREREWDVSSNEKEPKPRERKSHESKVKQQKLRTRKSFKRLFGMAQ